jgi:hypothetical protein
MAESLNFIQTFPWPRLHHGDFEHIGLASRIRQSKCDLQTLISHLHERESTIVLIVTYGDGADGAWSSPKRGGKE